MNKVNNQIQQAVQHCTELVNAFAYFVDHRQFADAVALFAEEGRFVRPDGVRTGHAEISAIWEGRPVTVVTRHLPGVPFFLSIDHNKASSVTQCTIYQAESDGKSPAKVSGPLGVAEFQDDFVNTEGGWKFLKRTVIPVIIESP